MATISTTAQSLAGQQFLDYEWLVIDGASTDTTLEIVDRYPLAGKRVYSAPDKGIYDAMNTAIGMAYGDWVYFLNSGDEFKDQSVLLGISTAIDQYKDVELFWGDMVYVAANYERLRRFRHISHRTLIFDDLNHQSIFARRSLFSRFGKFNLNFRTSADYDWLIRVFRGGVYYRYIPRVIARFAVGGAHSVDPEALMAERQRLRLQYISLKRLRLGAFVSRVRRRFRMAIGHGG